MADATNLHGALQGLVGQPCTGVGNPIGSTILLDIGELRRVDDASNGHVRGWRRLTINSPWRLQTRLKVICDWNSDNSPGGELAVGLSGLVGATLRLLDVSPPAWDMVMRWSNGCELIVFSDSDDLRDRSWFILGTDGLEIAAGPRAVMENGENWCMKTVGSRP